MPSTKAPAATEESSSTHPSTKASVSASTDALVIGAGPAGLMAAQMLAEAGRQVTLVEAKPSPARKLLMAGKSGLNITKDEDIECFLAHFDESAAALSPMLRAFGPEQVQSWAKSLGQELFSGTSGRVFPVSMKASPLLRAWLALLQNKKTTLRRNWNWQGFEGDGSLFNTPEGEQYLEAEVTVLALGGASWSKLGSDGLWTKHLACQGVELAPFAAANACLKVDWSEHMQVHFGKPIKSTQLSAGGTHTRGEFVISSNGLEGSGIYSVCKAVRQGKPLTVDLFPDSPLEVLQQKLSRSSGKASQSNTLRKTLALSGARLALLREFAHPLPQGAALAPLLKNLPLAPLAIGDLDGAISTAGGVPFAAMDQSLQLKAMPGVFCAGEMLDWEAPTGGYLLTACLATGRWAGIAAAQYRKQSSSNS